jgi:hypothetical protein
MCLCSNVELASTGENIGVGMVDSQGCSKQELRKER